MKKILVLVIITTMVMTLMVPLGTAAASFSGSISADMEVIARRGEIVQVGIYLENLSSVTGGGVTISLGSGLTLVRDPNDDAAWTAPDLLDPPPSAALPFDIDSSNVSDGYIELVFYNDIGVTGSGLLFVLNIKVNSDAPFGLIEIVLVEGYVYNDYGYWYSSIWNFGLPVLDAGSINVVEEVVHTVGVWNPDTPKGDAVNLKQLLPTDIGTASFDIDEANSNLNGTIGAMAVDEDDGILIFAINQISVNTEDNIIVIAETENYGTMYIKVNIVCTGFKWGDVNGDSLVDVNDAADLLLWIDSEYTTYLVQPEAGRVSARDNDNANLFDVHEILLWISSGGDSNIGMPPPGLS